MAAYRSGPVPCTMLSTPGSPAAMQRSAGRCDVAVSPPKFSIPRCSRPPALAIFPHVEYRQVPRADAAGHATGCRSVIVDGHHPSCALRWPMDAALAKNGGWPRRVECPLRVRTPRVCRCRGSRPVQTGRGRTPFHRHALHGWRALRGPTPPGRHGLLGSRYRRIHVTRIAVGDMREHLSGGGFVVVHPPPPMAGRSIPSMLSTLSGRRWRPRKIRGPAGRPSDPCCAGSRTMSENEPIAVPAWFQPWRAGPNSARYAAVVFLRARGSRGRSGGSSRETRVGVGATGRIGVRCAEGTGAMPLLCRYSLVCSPR